MFGNALSLTENEHQQLVCLQSVYRVFSVCQHVVHKYTPSLYPKQDLDPFSRFCSAQVRERRTDTDRVTDKRTTLQIVDRNRLQLIH